MILANVTLGSRGKETKETLEDVAESYLSPDGILLCPEATFPVEIYDEARLAEFRRGEAGLAPYVEAMRAAVDGRNLRAHTLAPASVAGELPTDQNT